MEKETGDFEKVLRQLSAVRSRSQQAAAGQHGYDKRGFIKLNMLTKRKCEKEKCELCDHTGTIACDKCRVTIYCTVEHFLMDKEFHAYLCSRNKAVKQPLEFHPLSETRERWAKQNRIRMEELMDFTCKKGQAFLEQGRFRCAIPSATVASKYARLLYGETDAIIPSLMIAAESFLRINNLVVADGFVARVLFIEANMPNLKPSLKARIRHIEGLMALARGRLVEATDKFSEEIYQTTEEFGPDHIKTSTGFCYLGHVFHRMKKFYSSSSLYRQTVDIWTEFLDPILEAMTSQSYLPNIAGVKKEEKIWLDDQDKFGGLNLLNRCYTEQLECVEHLKLTNVKPMVTELDLARTCYALAVIQYIIGRYSESEKCVATGNVHIADGDLKSHETTQKLHNVLKHARRKSYELEKMKQLQSSDTSLITDMYSDTYESLATETEH